MSGKSIFVAHQDLVGTWSDLVTTHEANLRLLLEKRGQDHGPRLALPSRGMGGKTVAIQSVCRTSEDALQIFSLGSLKTETEGGDIDLKLEYKRRALASLTFVIDEISVLKRRIEDGDAALMEDPKAVTKRVADLVGNLIQQCLGLLKTKLLYDGKLEKVRLIWLALADAICGLTTFSKGPANSDRMVFEALEIFATSLQASAHVTQSDRSALSEITVKTLKTWCEKALTAWDVFRCASLYLVLNRIGYKPSHGIFAKVYGLAKISPNLPVIFGRKCLKLEDFLFANVAPVPTYASNLNRDLSLPRRAFAGYVSSNIDDFSRRLAHDIVFKSNLQTAEKVRHLIFSTLFSHAMEKMALPKSTLGPLLVLAECLTACEEILCETPVVVAPEINIPSSSISQSSSGAKADPDYDFAMTLLNGARTLGPTRCIALSLSLACCSPGNPALADIHLQSEWEAMRNLRKCSDTASLFSPFVELFEPMVKLVVEGDLVQLSRRLQSLVRAFRPSLTCGSSEFDNTSATSMLMHRALKEWIVDYLFEEVDQTVRSRVVMKQSVDTDLPSFARKISSLRAALNCGPLDLGDGPEAFMIKDQVEAKLSRTWHEMRCTGIDRTWDTYAEMGVLAQEYFALNVFKDPLVPTVTAVTGCDVLEIAMDMEVFCTKYNYNLNQEFFIERRPHGKYVSLVTVDSIARSIRSHGSGILSTIVNVVYQFLALRFEQFSQSLFDDHVKSFLKRERRWMAKEQSASGGAYYPFERATDFALFVKSGSFLSKTRLIVTEIGNALAFVRSVRAGGMKWAGHVQSFLPPAIIQQVREAKIYRKSSALQDPAAPFSGSAISEDGGSTISGAVAEVDDAVRTLHKHVHDVACRQFPDYLLVLVDVFRKVESAKNEHLKNAFMVIPALCVDFVDASLHAKDQVARAHKNPNREAYFTDDGFVMGVAAVLAMLNQDALFDTLKFFKSVAVYFEGGTPAPGMVDDVDDDMHDGGKSNEFAGSDSVSGLSKRRHRGAAREYELLMYGLSGARVFFKRAAEDQQSTNIANAHAHSATTTADATPGASVSEGGKDETI